MPSIFLENNLTNICAIQNKDIDLQKRLTTTHMEKTTRGEKIAKAMMVIIGIALFLTDTGIGMTLGGCLFVTGICVGDWEE